MVTVTGSVLIGNPVKTLADQMIQAEFPGAKKDQGHKEDQEYQRQLIIAVTLV